MLDCKEKRERIIMDIKLAGSSPSSRRSQVSSSGPRSVRDNLPPITTESLPTVLQTHIACQSWDKVSARQPIGSQENEPDEEIFFDFASTILEMRLADVVKHRRDVKLSSGPPRSSRTSDDEWLAKGGHIEYGSFGEGKRSDTESSPTVLLTSSCRSQLRAYVRRIASLYRDNRYHGLEHAVHVTMSANKLLDMLHEGAVDSDDDTEINDFSVSEPCIMKETKIDKPLHNDSMHSLMSENGYKCSRGALDDASSSRQTAASARKSSLSEDFDIDRHHLRLKRPKPRPCTHLIYSDTFTKFAFVFAAIIHDVDHQGVPNTRLVLENDPIVELHGGISTAEKHSIKVAFRTLSESNFDEFRSVVFESPDDQLQMHRIVTNVVVSTDIASPDRMQSTKIRWEEAFSHPLPNTSPLPFGRLSLAGQSPLSEIATVQASKPQLVSMQNTSTAHHARQQRRNSITKRVLQLNGRQTVEYFTENKEEDENTRAALRHSVVIETMLNIADVAHSMQSWELFLFWNRKLYEELYVAFKSGRSGNDPSNGWYENQLGFYRLYVIPLAEKMKKCGVFGERGGEWVKNAILIRDQWSREGEQVTKNLIASVERDIRCYH